MCRRRPTYQYRLGTHTHTHNSTLSLGDFISSDIVSTVSYLVGLNHETKFLSLCKLALKKRKKSASMRRLLSCEEKGPVIVGSDTKRVLTKCALAVISVIGKAPNLVAKLGGHALSPLID